MAGIRVRVDLSITITREDDLRSDPVGCNAPILCRRRIPGFSYRSSRCIAILEADSGNCCNVLRTLIPCLLRSQHWRRLTCDLAGLIIRRQMVRTFRHADRNSRGTAHFLSHRHGRTGNGNCSNTGVAGFCGDFAISRPRDCEGRCGGIDINSRRLLAQAQGSRRLPNLPRNVLCTGSTVRPLIVGLRRKGRRVGPCIGSGRSTGHGHVGRIIVVPRRRLSAAVIGQRILLRRDRQASDTRDLAGLISRCQMIRTCSHLNGNSRRTRRLLCYRHSSSGHGNCSNIGIAGCRRDSTIAGPRYREGGRRGIVVYRCSVLAQRQRPGCLADAPIRCFGARGAIIPLIVSFRRKARRVASRVDPGGRPAQRHRGSVVVTAPGRPLRSPIISQCFCLRRKVQPLDTCDITGIRAW